eukprot:2822447-Lingulodinium_polyedra.AAC.1
MGRSKNAAQRCAQTLAAAPNARGRNAQIPRARKIVPRARGVCVCALYAQARRCNAHLCTSVSACCLSAV